MKPSYEELEEVTAIATALAISTSRRDSEAMKEDYAVFANVLRRLHSKYVSPAWETAVLAALERVQEREKDPWPLL